MATFTRKVYRIAQFIRWADRDELILQPKFQRRPSWENAARSYLIDTIVRELPLPKIYLRRVINPKTGLTSYEVVDGQQRLRAILDFYKGTLILSRHHNPELGDTTFDHLPDALQRMFLSYEIFTEVMEKASDQEVWAMFERLNSYTLTLNRQERLNAKWFGYFKQIAYKLAAEESALNSWKYLRVFSDRQIARMREVELTSDVLVAIVDGISDITDIARAYSKYDKEFPNQEEASEQFKTSLSWIVNELSNAVRVTRFRSVAWFYSIEVAIADMLSGIPQGLGPQTPVPSSVVQNRMLELNLALRNMELPIGLARLHGALSRATSHIPQRKTRHEFFFAMLTASDDAWHDLWIS